MAFRVKDLLISVLPEEKGAAVACPNCSLDLSRWTDPDRCGCGCTHCTNSFYTQGRSCFCNIAHPEDLATLKQQLKETLSHLEAREREVQEVMRPQSLDQMKKLEAKLAAALAEVKSHKARLIAGRATKSKVRKVKRGR
jgi:hypothetical protein